MAQISFRCVVALALVTACWACGNPMVQPPPEPGTETVAKPRAEVPTDAWSLYRGDKYKPGEVFRISRHPVGVEGPNFVVSISRVEKSSIEAPTGKKITDVTATLIVSKGEEQRQVTISAGDDRVVFDARIAVIRADEDYDAEHLTYLPWAEVKVTALAQ